MDTKRLVEGFIKGQLKVAITEISSVKILIELINVLSTYQYKWQNGEQFCLESSRYSIEYSDNFTYILNGERPFRIQYSRRGGHYDIVIPCIEFLKIIQIIEFYLKNW